MKNNIEIVILVNKNEVKLTERKVTGLQIKQAAISQDVTIEEDFILQWQNPGNQTKQVLDDEPITVHDGQTFKAVTPDDNS